MNPFTSIVLAVTFAAVAVWQLRALAGEVRRTGDRP